MMTYSITCSKCGERTYGSVVWGRYEYELPDGWLCSLSRSLGWCFGCQAFQPVEDLGSGDIDIWREYYENQIREMQARLEKLKRRSTIAKLPITQVEEQQLQCAISRKIAALDRETNLKRSFQAAMKTRLSPERCLKCGCTKVIKPIMPEIDDPQWTTDAKVALGMKHPPCGGELIRQEHALWINMRFDTRRIYSIEGEFLREEKAPV
jgi:hypothetical protein